MRPGMLWALLLCFFLASGIPIGRQSKSGLDAKQFTDLQSSMQLPGSHFELEDSANIRVDSADPASLDFAIAPATQFFAGSASANVLVVGAYREIVSTPTGVFFYIYWISQQQRTGLQVVFRKEQLQLNPLDIRLTFRPDLGLVLLDLWTCISGGSCSWASPSGTPWQMAQNIAYFSYNAARIPGPQTHFVTDPSHPSWFTSVQADWSTNGIDALLYAKGGINLKQLPCYATQQCADWDYIEIIPPTPDAPFPPSFFQNGYCAHINIQKSTETDVNLAGALFGLYLPLGDPSQKQKGAKVGECTTNSVGFCTIRADPGTKLLFEDRAPIGYLPIAPEIVDIPTTGMMITYPLKDKATTPTGIKIQKYSGYDGTLVSGASFEITQTLTNGTVITWTITNASSTFCTDFPPSQINIKKFPTDANGCLQVKITEIPPPGFLPLVMDNVTFCISKDPNKQECTARPALRLKNMPTPFITLTKLGTPGVSVTGTILGVSQSGDPNLDYSTIPAYARCTIPSTSNVCKIRAPTLGLWYVHEIQPTGDYERADPQGPFDIQDGGTYYVTVQNNLKCYGAPTIERYDCNGQSMALTGAQYSVTSGGRTVQFFAQEGDYRFCLDNGTNIFPLDHDCCGDFTITETVPPTGQQPATQQTKQVHFCGFRTPPNCGERPVDETFNSPPCLGSFKLIKNGESGVLPGVTFNFASEALGYSVNKVTGSDGSACWDGLSEGSYVLTEVSTLPDYHLETGPRVYNIDPESGDSCTYPSSSDVWVNYKQKGSVKIIKMGDAPSYTGGGSIYLAGAVFLVKRVGSSWQQTYTTTGSGVLCISLDLGTYTIEEQTPPTGYSKDVTVRTVTVTASTTCTNTIYTWTDRLTTNTYPPSYYYPANTYAPTPSY